MIDPNKDVTRLLPREAVEAASKVCPIGFRLTEIGNAERLVARYRDRIRYCYPRRHWLVWDGKRWAWDDAGHVVQLAKETVRAIYEEAARETDDKRREAIVKHAAASEKSQRIRAMIELAQSEPGIPVTPAELDSDPWLFNVANGTIDLRTGEIGGHRRSDLITRLAPVEYDPEARSDLWDSVLSTVTNGDAELAAYLQRLFGYALQGTPSEKRLFFVYGPPDTGKSTLLLGVGNAFGEYHETADAETWCVCWRPVCCVAGGAIPSSLSCGAGAA